MFRGIHEHYEIYVFITFVHFVIFEKKIRFIKRPVNQKKKNVFVYEAALFLKFISILNVRDHILGFLSFSFLEIF